MFSNDLLNYDFSVQCRDESNEEIIITLDKTSNLYRQLKAIKENENVDFATVIYEMLSEGLNMYGSNEYTFDLEE